MKAAWWIARTLVGIAVVVPIMTGARVLHAAGAVCDATAERLENVILGGD
jgi:hypothetical protein